VSGVDLVTFLRARLDERERVALDAASTSQGTARMRGAYSTWVVEDWHGDSDDPQALVSQGTDRSPAALGQFTATPIPRRHGIHIALNDPAFVLADVAAKRRLLDLHEPIPSCSAGILQCRHCADLCHSGSGLSCDSPDAPYPCPTVRLLAASFAAHPDFDPAWAVT
jgi:hypothetical protein